MNTKKGGKAMKNSIKWSEKYKLALKESLSIKDIMNLRDCGQPKATKIRDEAIKYCIENNIRYESKKVPTEIVLNVTNYDLNYYYEKMLLESKCLNN